VLTSTPTGVILDVRVIPRAKKTQVGGVRDGTLVVRLAAPPVEGAANAAAAAVQAALSQALETGT
jgi:uncharacterized protein